MNIAYHLVAESWYRFQSDDSDYRPESFDVEGFVHLTRGLDEALAVGNRYYQTDPRPYVLLTIDLSAITSETRYEDRERRFPHVHGPLDRAAIVAVRPLTRAGDGGFLGVESSATGQ